MILGDHSITITPHRQPKGPLCRGLGKGCLNSVSQGGGVDLTKSSCNNPMIKRMGIITSFILTFVDRRKTAVAAPLDEIESWPSVQS
jgi:hypothetical protein